MVECVLHVIVDGTEGFIIAGDKGTRFVTSYADFANFTEHEDVVGIWELSKLDVAVSAEEIECWFTLYYEKDKSYYRISKESGKMFEISDTISNWNHHIAYAFNLDKCICGIRDMF